MSSHKESTGRTLFVAFAICLVCSVLVAGAAITLRPTQVENRLLDTQRSILSIAGLETPGMSADEVRGLFGSKIFARVVDLQTGKFTDQFDAQSFDPIQASRDPQLSDALSGADDLASIKRRERFSTVYLVEEQGELKSLIIPVRGYGLWSTMYGFIALESDLDTIVGFGFYQHGETPGLGGEIDNPKWKAQFPGKRVFDEQGRVAVSVLKGADPQTNHEVDALAGATLTSNGVDHLLKFWLGESGFGPFIANLRAGEA